MHEHHLCSVLFMRAASAAPNIKRPHRWHATRMQIRHAHQRGHRVDQIDLKPPACAHKVVHGSRGGHRRAKKRAGRALQLCHDDMCAHCASKSPQQRGTPVRVHCMSPQANPRARAPGLPRVLSRRRSSTGAPAQGGAPARGQAVRQTAEQAPPAAVSYPAGPEAGGGRKTGGFKSSLQQFVSALKAPMRHAKQGASSAWILQ